MALFKKNELDYKSVAISVMYLENAKHRLEEEMKAGKRAGEDEAFTATYDIKCLENAIRYLQS